MVFLVVMYGCEKELDHEESWVLKNWCFWNVVLEKTLENPLDCKEIKPVYPKGNQFWILIGMTDAEAWSPNTLATWFKDLTHWKRPRCWERLKSGGEGNDRRWNDWMASPTLQTWVEQTPGVDDGQKSLSWCQLCHKELDMTESLNWTEQAYITKIVMLCLYIVYWVGHTHNFSAAVCILVSKYLDILLTYW